MKVKPHFTETIDGVVIEYLTDWDGRFGKTITHVTKEHPMGERVSTKDHLREFGRILAALANKKGFKRVQVGSYGDWSYYGLTSRGPFLPLSTMFSARFLKR